MTPRLLGPATLLLGGLLAGAALTNFLLEGAVAGPLEFQVRYKQLVVTALPVVLPLLALGTVVAGAAWLGATRAERGPRWWAAAVAVGAFAVALIMTATVHAPLNAVIAAWDPAAPPADAVDALARWQAANTLRTILVIAGFAVLAAAVPSTSPIRATPAHSASPT
ncbi:MAG: anthrone oxygenase family protein [Pseudonocardia sp.]